MILKFLHKLAYNYLYTWILALLDEWQQLLHYLQLNETKICFLSSIIFYKYEFCLNFIRILYYIQKVIYKHKP